MDAAVWTVESWFQLQKGKKDALEEHAALTDNEPGDAWIDPSRPYGEPKTVSLSRHLHRRAAAPWRPLRINSPMYSLFYGVAQ